MLINHLTIKQTKTTLTFDVYLQGISTVLVCVIIDKTIEWSLNFVMRYKKFILSILLC